MIKITISVGSGYLENTTTYVVSPTVGWKVLNLVAPSLLDAGLGLSYKEFVDKWCVIPSKGDKD